MLSEGREGGADTYTIPRGRAGPQLASSLDWVLSSSNPACKISNTPSVRNSRLILGPEMDPGLVGPEDFAILGSLPYKLASRTSLEVQWLRLHTSTAGGHRFDPWSGN